MHLGYWLKGSESLTEGYRSMTIMSSKLLMQPVFYTTICVQPEWMLGQFPGKEITSDIV